jgi:hypothetical protein
MNEVKNTKRIISSLLIIIILLGGSMLPTVFAGLDDSNLQGFEKGITWKPFVPMKKVTFVQHDMKSLLDDYGYLSAIPSSVFYSEKSDKMYSSPLLFYEEEFTPDSYKELTFNARQGIDYFMEDWMGYAQGNLDQLTLINVDEQTLGAHWDATDIDVIEESNPFALSHDIAINDWEYSDDAVVAVIEDTYEKPENITQGTIENTLYPGSGMRTEHFEVPQTNEVYPQYNEFTVPEGYKFLKVRSWYPCFYLEAGIPGFEGIINMSIPAGDRDIQVYVDENGQWMMAGITSEWNAQGGMDIDKTSVYVYKSGRWSVAITDVPTKEDDYLESIQQTVDDVIPSSLEVQKHHSFLIFNFGRYGRIIDILKNMRQVTYQVDVEMYPGIEFDIPDLPPYGCRDVQINLTWDDPNVDLGFSLIGPSGEEVLSTREPGVSMKCNPSSHENEIPLPQGTETDMHVNQLGECLPGEHYRICVFTMNEMSQATDFTIKYSWEQNFSKQEGAGLACATEGAVLASEKNCPLLYVNTNSVPEETFDALYQLGVKNVYLIDLDGFARSNVVNELKNTFHLSSHITTYDDVYAAIRDISDSNDVVFSTIDPWTSWEVAQLVPGKEYRGARSIGPAAYIAAHHGSPVLLIDNHPELSSAVVWHNELWRRHPDGSSRLPTVSEMYLTGTRVYQFLRNHNFDQEGEESLITLGGQYDIGLSWDRMFVGKAKPGRFFGSPTDISVWVVKNVFYPMIIFENPGIKNTEGVTLINGSSSERRFPWRGKLGLKITKPSEEEVFRYPVLDTLVCYDIKFNTRASKYWGFEYTCADGTVPGISPSFNPIDEGVMIDVNGEQGGFFPDLSGAEVQPFYLKQGGYEPVFSTKFDANMYDLNQGVLLWMVNTHGSPMNGGSFMFWDVNSENPSGAGYPAIPLAGYNKEDNPWRGYEWLMGSTEEPDTMTMEVHGILPALMGNPNPIGIRFIKTGLDWALAKRPIRDILGEIASLPIIRYFTPEWFQDTQDYYDGVIITVLLGRFGTSWYNGTQVDDALENIHSAGISSVACLPAGKYLHLALMRHGSPYQIMDPWATSWYSDVWQNGVPRGIALGQTMGEIYMEGIKKVGIQYVSDGNPQWWWDLAENVCLYGDPNLRTWVPSTEYSSNNNWDSVDVQPLSYNSDEGFIIDGHTPFGASQHTHKRNPSDWINQYLIVIIAFVLIIALLMVSFLINRKKQ